MPLTDERALRWLGLKYASKHAAGFFVKDGKINMSCNDATLTQDPTGITCVCWAADWSRLAFPIITTSHKYAAALMTTTIPDVPIVAPWPAFLMRIPNGMLSLEHDGELINLRHAMVVNAIDYWYCLAIAENDMSISRTGFTTAAMRAGDVHASTSDGDSLTTHDARALTAITRLIMNACLAMSDPRSVRPVGKATPAPTIDSTGMPKYKGGTFQVGGPVSVDCRQPLAEFLLGVPHSKSTMRWLVRGHWRNQACGPNLTSRAMKWIEPYWKGERENALLIRHHELRRATEQ